MKQAARCEERHDWHEEQLGERSRAAEGHAANSIEVLPPHYQLPAQFIFRLSSGWSS